MATITKVNPHVLIADGPITFWKSDASGYSSYHIAIQSADQRALLVKMSENEAARLFEWLAHHLAGAIRS